MLAITALVLAAPPAVATTALALALMCRALMVRMVDRALRLPRTALWLMPLRDVLSFAVFVASFFARNVAWRDRIFRVGPDGQLIPGRR
jgi:ceramide glucosyltransferase